MVGSGCMVVMPTSGGSGCLMVVVVLFGGLCMAVVMVAVVMVGSESDG